jgi:Flp pilus assembly protein TadG
MTRRQTQQREGFWASRRGATAVEFALIALPLITLIFASLQVAVIFFFDQALQTATQKAARQLLTGSVQDAGLSQKQFENIVCGNLPTQFNCNNLMVDVESSSSFAAANTAPLVPANNPNNNWSYSPGNAGDIVIMRVMYDWPVLGGPLAVGLANQPDGGHLMVATAVFKNEPFQ